MKTILKNIKTTAAGAVVVIGLVGPYTGLINRDQANLLVSAATAIGLVAAKDGNVTGGTKENR